MDVWADVKTTAKALGVSEETVRRWLRSGEISGLILNDRSGYRIRYGEIQRFLSEMEERQTAERRNRPRKPLTARDPGDAPGKG